MAEGNVQGNQYAGQACLYLFSFICEIYINTETCEEKEEKKRKNHLTLLIAPTKEAKNVLIFGLSRHVTRCWDKGYQPDQTRFKFNDYTEN